MCVYVLLHLMHMLLAECVSVRVCACVCTRACVRVCACSAMQPSGAGASLPDSRDLAALAVGHAGTRQEEVATVLRHFLHPSPFLPTFLTLLNSISLT